MHSSKSVQLPAAFSVLPPRQAPHSKEPIVFVHARKRWIRWCSVTCLNRTVAHLSAIDLTNTTSDTFIDIIAKDTVTGVAVKTTVAFMITRSILADSTNRGAIVITKSTFINISTCNLTITSVSSITKTLMIAWNRLIRSFSKGALTLGGESLVKSEHIRFTSFILEGWKKRYREWQCDIESLVVWFSKIEILLDLTHGIYANWAIEFTSMSG